jgi:tRNA (uracil-5-)-methyltransferase
MPSSVLIEGLSSDLSGYGFVDGRKVSFPYVSLGDEIEFETFGRGKRRYNKILSHKKSINLESGCEYFSKCGGCKGRHISYDEQFHLKTNDIVEFYKNNYNIQLELVPSKKTENYRNRMDFAVFPEAIGLRQEGNFRKIIEIDKCNIQSNKANEELKIIKSIVRQYAFNRKTLEGFLKYITIRINSENELTLILTFINSFRDTIFEENLSSELKKVSISENIIFCYNRTQSEVSAVGEFKVIKGREFFRERVLETYFDVPFTAFFQPNPSGFLPIIEFINKNLLEIPAKTLVDLFCGTGFFSLLFGEKFDEIIGFDIVPSSIEKAQEMSRKKFPFKKLNFEVIDLLTLKNLASLEVFKKREVLLLLDPPRNGIGLALAEEIKKSEIENIIYVSCNPRSQIEDWEVLKEKFKIGRGLITDPFPHTPHLESVLLLEKRND